MSYIKLQAHYVLPNGRGVNIGAVNLTMVLGNGTTVDIPVPFLPVTESLAVCPNVAPDGQTRVRIDFAGWSPIRYGAAGAARFPFWLDSQALAVRVARAFDTDPATGWSDPPEQIETWLTSWLAANGDVRATGGAGATS